MVFRTLLRLLGTREGLDDLAQDCFLRLYRAMPTFRGEALVSTYLYRIAVNVAQDEWKRRRREDARARLLSCVLCGQIHQRRCRFDTGQLLEKVKRGLGICVSEFKQLGVIVLNTFKDRGHGAFDSVGPLRGGCTDLLVAIPRLRGAFFNSLAKIKSRLRSVLFGIVHVLIL